MLVEQAAGPGVKNAAPAGVAEDERFLTPGGGCYASRWLMVAVGGVGLPDAPADRGSGHRHSHVRGLGSQGVVAQKWALHWRRHRSLPVAENERASGLRWRLAGASGKSRVGWAPIGNTLGLTGSFHAVISAQTNPASSLATAAATVFLFSLRAAR